MLNRHCLFLVTCSVVIVLNKFNSIQFKTQSASVFNVKVISNTATLVLLTLIRHTGTSNDTKSYRAAKLSM